LCIQFILYVGQVDYIVEQEGYVGPQQGSIVDEELIW